LLDNHIQEYYPQNFVYMIYHKRWLMKSYEFPVAPRVSPSRQRGMFCEFMCFCVSCVLRKRGGGICV